MTMPRLIDLFSGNVRPEEAEYCLGRFAAWYKFYREEKHRWCARIYFAAFWRLANVLNSRHLLSKPTGSYMAAAQPEKNLLFIYEGPMGDLSQLAAVIGFKPMLAV